MSFSNNSSVEYNLKICILGNLGVGKTSIVHRFTEGTFRTSYKRTIGVNLLSKDLKVEEYGEVKLRIWDIAGQQSFKTFHDKYLAGSDGAFVVFDVTDNSSFRKIGEWIESFRKVTIDNPIHLIGNKIDLKGSISVLEEGKSYAAEQKMKFTATSAKTGENVENAFKELIRQILKKPKSFV
ncbi:MAG: GTP-binding protein [Candidatus Lokiarchaeota archaeon]|nr:GTP-binding protein [Candidatus Lokiarchaeota archaeon]